MPTILGEIRNDEDLDGLSDNIEESIGTDPTTSDTDGDRLRDSWEYRNETADGEPLPEADPLRKDLFVQINYAKGVVPLSAQEKQDLIDIWRKMPVGNPSGQTGITLHIDDSPPDGGVLDRRITENFETTHQSSANTTTDFATEYTTYVPQGRQCTYHLALLVHPDDPIGFGDSGSNVVGRGEAPGYIVKVDGNQRNRTGQYSYRASVLTHELLHNIVGKVRGDYHRTEGWLSHKNHEYLSGITADYLNQSGFNESASFEEAFCEQR